MRPAITISSLTLALAIALFASSAGASVIATMPRPPDFFPNFFAVEAEGHSRAQTFSAESDGLLGSIELTLIDLEDDPRYRLADEITLQIRDTRDATPGGIDLLRGEVTRARSELGSLTSATSVVFDFSAQSIDVRRDQVLAWVLGPGTGGALQMPRSLRRPPLDLYAGGSAFDAPDFGDEFVRLEGDYAFRITIVPEPGPLLLLGLGMVGLALHGHREGSGRSRADSVATSIGRPAFCSKAGPPRLADHPVRQARALLCRYVIRGWA